MKKATKQAAPRLSLYQQYIMQDLGCSAKDARLVEGFMRLEHGTLDALSPELFRQEAEIGFVCVKADRKEAEILAKSYGL